MTFRVVPAAPRSLLPSWADDPDDVLQVERMMAAGRSIPAIAASLGTSEGAVRVAISQIPALQQHLARSMEIQRSTVALGALAEGANMVRVLVNIAQNDESKDADRIKAASKVLDVAGVGSATQQKTEAEVAGRQHVQVDAGRGLMDRITEIVQATAAGTTAANIAMHRELTQAPPMQVVDVDCWAVEAPALAVGEVVPSDLPADGSEPVQGQRGALGKVAAGEVPTLPPVPADPGRNRAPAVSIESILYPALSGRS